LVPQTSQPPPASPPFAQAIAQAYNQYQSQKQTQAKTPRKQAKLKLPTLTCRIAIVEEQLRQLANVKTIVVEQIKGNQDLKELVEWKQTSSRTAAYLQASIDNLTP
jgi:hypothetical protein